MPDFRREHYFDTHHIAKYQEIIGKYTYRKYQSRDDSELFWVIKTQIQNSLKSKIRIVGDKTKAEPHTCIHQFKLNSRQLLECVEKDVLGRSLCKICGKAMEGSSLDVGSKLFTA